MADLTTNATATPNGTAATIVMLSAGISGGVPPYTALWSGVPVMLAGNADTIATPRASGTFTASVAVEDSVGSIARSSVTFTLPALPTFVSHGLLAVSAGRSCQLKGTVTDQFNKPIAGAVITWSATGSATVTAGGLLTGTAAGEVTLTATCGLATNTVTYVVLAAASLTSSYSAHLLLRRCTYSFNLDFTGVPRPSPVTITATAGTINSVAAPDWPPYTVGVNYTAPDAGGPVTFTDAATGLSVTFNVNPAPIPEPTDPTPCTVTLVDAADQPIVGATVWATSDAAGTTTVAGPALTTPAGTAVLQLVAGQTYYLTALKSGQQRIENRPFVAVAG